MDSRCLPLRGPPATAMTTIPHRRPCDRWAFRLLALVLLAHAAAGTTTSDWSPPITASQPTWRQLQQQASLPRTHLVWTASDEKHPGLELSRHQFAPQGSGSGGAAPPTCSDADVFAALSARVMEHCCPQPSAGQPPPPGGASADCELPPVCDNTGCADEYMLFFDSCLPTLSNLPTARFSVLEAFNIGCEVSEFTALPHCA